MKKFLSSLVLAISICASSAFAQTGPVYLNNFDTGNGIFTVGGGLATTAFVQLYVGADAGSLSLVTSSGGQSTFSLVEPGFFDSGFGYTTLANSASGYFRLVAWTGGADFASATVRGSVDWTQNVGVQLPGSPTLPPPGPVALNNPVLNMAVVPEPTTVALAVMGGLGLLARRRRNQA